MRILPRSLSAVLAAVLCCPAAQADDQPATPIDVRVSKSYELANVILALTPYGRSDEWEVLKDTAYHREVLAFFEPCRDHPLLAQVNYSRDLWEEYLAFRSDAYAFEYPDDGKLHRVSTLHASGRVSPFDDHLAQVEDFARQCRFDAFYQAHADYYRKIAAAYRDAYMFPQMLDFLRSEFGQAETHGRYLIVLSPLVGRMNAQRRVGSDQLSFVSPARGLLEGGAGSLPRHDRIVELHTLFTEIDHAFVNPVSDMHRAAVDASFDWRAWAGKSGYESNYQAFNEYMTWAAYDLFVRRHFADAANTAIANWHLQNKSRGFIASERFAAQLAQLRQVRQVPLRELFPAMLAWAGQAQASLAVPTLVSARTTPRGAGYRVRMRFSQAMQASPEIIVKRILRDAQGETRRGPPLTLSYPAHRLRWRRGGTVLEFDLPAREAGLVGLTFNWWDTTPLQGRNGLYLSPSTKLLFDEPPAVP